MHLLLPFASPPGVAPSGDSTAAQALRQVPLPQLQALLAGPGEWQVEVGDGWSFSPPHERALAMAWGWPVEDGLLPLAAVQAAADGLPVDFADHAQAWGLLSPAHWHLGTEQVSMADPEALQLDDASSRAFLAALAPVFDDEGTSLHWGAPTRWYMRQATLASLATASLDRVIGRNVDAWLGQALPARALRRRQAEAQMLLHTHPLNAEREAAGALVLNSFWLSGTGPTRAVPPVPGLTVDTRLRGPALAGDASAWAAAWAALDAGPVATLRAQASTGGPAQLTLCGERCIRRWTARPAGGWWRRLFTGRAIHPAEVLLSLDTP